MILNVNLRGDDCSFNQTLFYYRGKTVLHTQNQVRINNIPSLEGKQQVCDISHHCLWMKTLWEHYKQLYWCVCVCVCVCELQNKVH